MPVTLRFWPLRYTRRTHDTTIDVRVHLDRLILEQRQDGSALAHLVSLVGNDADIGGVWAAILDGRTFWLSAPRLGEGRAPGGDKPQSWRGANFISRVVRGTGKAFLHWIGKAVKRGVIQVPESKGPATWPTLQGLFEPKTMEPAMSYRGLFNSPSSIPGGGTSGDWTQACGSHLKFTHN